MYEEEKIVLSEKITNCGSKLPDFDKSFRTAFDFLENPQKLWASERLEDKRTVLKLAFVDRVVFERNKGFRTTPIAQPFKALGDISRYHLPHTFTNT